MSRVEGFAFGYEMASETRISEKSIANDPSHFMILENGHNDYKTKYCQRHNGPKGLVPPYYCQHVSQHQHQQQ